MGLKETEADAQKQLVSYLKWQYPGLIFNHDLGGMQMTYAQVQHAKNLGRVDSYPDLIVCRSCGGYHALFIELKRKGVRLKKKNGDWSSKRISKQAQMLERLRLEGYAAEFAVGFDEAKSLVDSYLAGRLCRSTNSSDTG